MKKALIYGLSAALLLSSLIACGKPDADQQITEPEPPQIQATIPEAETTPEPEPEQIPAVPEPLSETVPVESDETEDSQTPEETAPLELFTDVNETVYATGTVNIRESWTADSSKVGSLSTGNSVTRTGVGKSEADGWSRVSLSDGSIAFINNSYLSTTKPVVQQQQASGGGKTTQSTQTAKKSGDQDSSQTKQTPAPAPAPSKGTSGGMSAEDRAALEELAAARGMTVEQLMGISTGPISEAEARSMTTDGWTAVYD